MASASTFLICGCKDDNQRTFSAEAQMMDLSVPQNTLKIRDKYDLVVIGGGSAGVSCALEANKLGLSVALVNYVKPSQHGNKWGLGGTCLNVGCIPKFFYHEAANMRRDSKLRKAFGFLGEEKETLVNWTMLSNSVSNYIKSESYRLGILLRTNKIKVFNKYAKFLNENEVALFKYHHEEDGEVKGVLKADNFLIATGERPVTEIEGYEGLWKALSTDDLFRVKKRPKKVLILGGGFSALEVASFMRGLGVDTTCYNRSKFIKSKGKLTVRRGSRIG
jgi:thioredoxin reductase (NADPH)